MARSTKPVVLITGASSGVGAACTRHLSHSACEVFTFARGGIASNHWLQDLLLEEDRALDEERLAEFVVEQIWNREGRIHAVVNCLDYGLAGAIEETTLKEARALFEANVFDMIRICRTVLPLMREQRSGLIINVGLAPDAVPPAFRGVYSASRRAMEVLSNTLDPEVEPFGVQVALIQTSSSAAARGMPVTQQARRETSVYKERLDRSRSFEIDGRPDESQRSAALLIEGLIRESVAGTPGETQQRRSPRLFTPVGPYAAGSKRSSVHAGALTSHSPSYPPLATFAGTWSERDKQQVEEAILSFEISRLQQGAAGPECWTCTGRSVHGDAIYVAYRGGEGGPFTAHSSRELARLISEKRAAQHPAAYASSRRSAPQPCES